MIMDVIMKVFGVMMAIADWFFGLPMLVLTGGIAIVYTITNRGFQFTHFGYVLKNTIMKSFGKDEGTKSGKGISSFKATCMALSNTLGVGNIAGVSLAIALGGPGAVFWIWMAGLLGMIIKYGEITLGVKYREIDPETGMYRGGIMWYIEKGLGKNWKWMAVIYAIVYIISGINGPAVQVNTLATSVTDYFNVPSVAVGLATVAILMLVLLGELKRISEFAGKVIPLISLSYIFIVIVIIVLNIKALPETIAMILKYAVTDHQAILGGFGGASVSMAIRYGIARGFYSNGAGTGDSPFAHSSADVEHPSQQGIWGIAEVIIDAVVCTGTALIVLVTGAWESGESGAPLTAKAISTAVGSEAFGSIFIMVMVFFFALTTAVMCAYYGEISVRYFTKSKKAMILYRIILCVYAVFCTNPYFVERLDIVWRIGDFNSVFAMTISIVTLWLLRKDVAECTREYKEMIKEQRKQKEGIS